ncbi:MAG: acetate--CoA ligase family protein [Bacteroidales bacterium]
MINEQLLNPRSIVVAGGSDDITKPGGKVLRNIIDGSFKGELSVINPRSDSVQGISSYPDPASSPAADLAIIAVAAKYCHQLVESLIEKGTRAFIILSAGFGEESSEGAAMEKSIVESIDKVGGCLIGPNCIGVLTPGYHGVFTLPIPVLDPGGVDFVSGSGATAVFIMESAIPNGVKFSSVYSVGNSAQTGVEDVIKYLDESFNPETSSRVKLLYIESISKPEMLLRHATSLVKKGCRIAAVKAGTSEAGSRAASSHTGALASPDVAVEALFRKAGIVRCYSRAELAAVAAVMLHKPLKGKNIAVVTHAGGPAVMMTDALSEGGLNVPPIRGEKADELLSRLFPGSSVSNPIDFLATGTAEQMGFILDSCENDFDDIDAVAVIFGSPGLFPVDDVYRVLDEKMKAGRKPVFPVLPSLITAGREVNEFLSKGRMNFPDEVQFARALSRVASAETTLEDNAEIPVLDTEKIREIIDISEDGYLDPAGVSALLDAAGIPRVDEGVAETVAEIQQLIDRIGFPIVMKVVGPVHKSDVGGVVIGVATHERAVEEFHRLMSIRDASGVLIQPVARGTELFAGVKREGAFGHLVMCGLGGIFIEVMKDVAAGLAPLGNGEVSSMIRSLRGYRLLEGARGKEGVNIEAFADIVVRLSHLVSVAPEIFEMDINPLLGSADDVVAVDARIRVVRR